MNIPTPAQLKPRHNGRDPRQGFTLIELLVVIAITAVLFFLMVRPLIEGLRLTQRAQLQAAAQDSARKTLEIVTRELSSAVYVFDNASHPFVLTGTASFAATDDRFTNFLNLDVPTKTGTTVAHAYYAKLDLVPARHSNATGGLTDPTNGDQPIKVSGTSLNDTGLLFPLAPGSTIIRYFIGLKNPEDRDSAANLIRRPYANTNERLGTGSTDNTYIMYRVQVTVSNPIDATTHKPAVNRNDGTTINELLFAPQHDASGAIINKPELDDPDFFRIVSATDTNWLSATHAPYGTAGATAHNTRVDYWYQIAKPVITAPNIDLLLLPRNPDGTVRFDSSGNPGSGSTTDPLNAGTSYPTVGTSVTFKPATVSADAAPNASSDYAGAGVPLNAADALGLPYIPTVYTASAQSWGYPYHINLYPLHNLDSAGNRIPNGTPTYDVRFPSFTTDTDRSGATADMIEYEYVDPTTTTAVYDITQNNPISLTIRNYVPMIVNPDTGTISFAVPALPFPGPPVDTTPKDVYNRFFKVTVGDITNVNSINGQAVAPGVVAPGLIDLTDNAGTQFANMPFKNTPLAAPGTAPSGAQVANAHLVPGSVRVYGPDATPGPTQGTRTLYTPVAPGGTLGYNQYRVDYLNSTLMLYVDAQHLLTTTGSATGTSAAQQNIEIAFDYQANLAPTVNSLLDIGKSGATAANSAITAANPALPMQVKVDYPTRDLLDINIGVRVYDPTNGQAFTVPVSNRVKVNNSHR